MAVTNGSAGTNAGGPALRPADIYASREEVHTDVRTRDECDRSTRCPPFILHPTS
jgi:hypothetical protein